MAGFGNSGGGFGFGGNQNNAPPGGFGGGFGSAPTAQPGSFGTAPFGSTPSSSLGGMAPAPPPTAFGSSPNVATSFTNASTPASGGSFGGGFASAPSTGGFGGVGGFGSVATAPFNSGFGGSTAAPPVSGFGGASPSTGFGNNYGGGFGPTPVSTPTTAAGFGAAPAAPTSGFGVAPAAQSSGFGIAAPSAPSTTGFGSGNFGVAPAVSGFGASSTFGAAQTSSGFGAAPVSSGFASAPTASGMSFGTSSNVMAATPASSSGFGHATPQSSGWNTTSSASNPFGAASSGFNSGPSDSADGMMDTRNATQSGFGGGTHRDDGGNITFRPNNASLSPVPEVGMGDATDGDERKQAEVKLKAKIEEKKRILAAKLEEKRKKQLEKEVEKKRQSQASTSLNASAPPFAPSNISRSRDKKDEQSLAERNALRFGDQSNRTKTRDMLPSDMKAKESIGQTRRAPSPVVDTPSDQQKATAREDLQSAKALVGTCEYFCPDEELLRRERESDIQQLEIPLPGKLHPDDWTLRNTVVKRFRRSAADYKLDVPEWVRPPDVLEMVCGYLEEWVMVCEMTGGFCKSLLNFANVLVFVVARNGIAKDPIHDFLKVKLHPRSKCTSSSGTGLG